MTNIKTALAVIAVVMGVPGVASALEYNTGKFSAKLTGYATGGIIEPEFKSTLFIGDWRARGQITYDTMTRTDLVLFMPWTRRQWTKATFPAKHLRCGKSRIPVALKLVILIQLRANWGWGCPMLAGCA